MSLLPFTANSNSLMRVSELRYHKLWFTMHLKIWSVFGKWINHLLSLDFKSLKAHSNALTQGIIFEERLTHVLDVQFIFGSFGVFNQGSHIARTWVNTKPTIVALPLPLQCIVCPELSCQDITFLPDRGEQIETDCHFYSLTWEKIFKRRKNKNRLDPLPRFWSIRISWAASAN